MPERLIAEDLQGGEVVVMTCRDGLDAAQNAVLDAAARAGRLVTWTGPAACEGKLPAAVQVEGAPSVWATVRVNAGTGEVAVHLLNRNYDLERDAVTRTGHLRKTIPTGLLGGKRFRNATLYAIPEGGSRTVELAADGDTTTVEVPELGLWSIILLE